MSFTPALSGMLPWLALIGVPVGIVLLYFLKLRREPVEVPSTYLWSRTIEDLHVNSLMQRLRNSILLLLQLLAVLLAAAALFRPGVRDETSSLGRMVFLLDTSASMQAPARASTETDAGQTRFQLAVERIEKTIDAMTDSESAMLIAFNDRAEVMQAFTSDRSRLREALSRCEVSNRSTDILGALKAADGLANPRRSSEVGDVNDVQVADAMPAEMLLFSDGGFQDVTEFNLGNLKPTYYAIGSTNSKNLAIASFSASRDLQNPGEVEVFATVVNTGTESVKSDASLFLDDTLLDAAAVDLDPDDQSGLSFTVQSEEAIKLRLQLDLDDDLAIDNVAYAALTPSGLVNVLVVTEGNNPLELGLTTDKCQSIATCEFVSPDYLTTKAYQQRASTGTDDLIIYDRCRPEKLPATNSFTIGELPSDEWQWSGEPSSLTLIDVDRTHPILRYLELYSLLVFSGRSIEGPKGSVPLVESDLGTILAVSPRGSYRDLVLGFELVRETEDGDVQANTNWYAERSWPVFLFNVLRHLAGAAQSSSAPSYRPGETVISRLESVVTDVEVNRDDALSGDETVLKSQTAEGGLLEITETSLPGNYQIVTSNAEEDEVVVDRFAVNLFDSRESKLAARADAELGYEKIEGVSSSMESRREYWRWLLLAALAILASEWWLYMRRLA